ncbi:MAG: glycosyltransferase family 1 protein [Chloroflexi bacterium]|nr:glycosyltransferase family 1 protein [Chloroflexota bacterium]
MAQFSQPLRLAMLSVHTSPLAQPGGKKTGGMNVYVRELSVELGRRGHQVDVFTRIAAPDTPQIRDDLGPNVRVVSLPAGPERALSSDEIFDHLDEFAAALSAFTERDTRSYDVIHSHYWLSGLVAKRIQANWHAPVLQMFHTLGEMKNRIAQDGGEGASRTRIRAERHIMQQADRIIAATPAERIQLLWLYGADMQKIEIIPPGVNVERFCPISRTQARTALDISLADRLLLFAGRIERLKGLDTLLEAMAILNHPDAPNVDGLTLTIIGGELDSQDPELERLQTMRDQLGLHNVVSFVGAKDQDALHYYYSAAEMVIMPSQYESFGMVALEAMACGTPVIASEVGGLAYLVQDGVTGFHVPSAAPRELADKIHLLLTHEGLNAELSEAAVRVARGYAWPLIADRIERLYQEVLGL